MSLILRNSTVWLLCLTVALATVIDSQPNYAEKGKAKAAKPQVLQNKEGYRRGPTPVSNRQLHQARRQALGISSVISYRGQRFRVVRKLTMDASSYVIGDRFTPGTTGAFSHKRVKSGEYGDVAVDPRTIERNSTLWIVGHGIKKASDTFVRYRPKSVRVASRGGRYRTKRVLTIVSPRHPSNKIDICNDSIAKALKFGRRKVQVFVLEKI